MDIPAILLSSPFSLLRQHDASSGAPGRESKHEHTCMYARAPVQTPGQPCALLPMCPYMYIYKTGDRGSVHAQKARPMLTQLAADVSWPLPALKPQIAKQNETKLCCSVNVLRFHHEADATNCLHEQSTLAETRASRVSEKHPPSDGRTSWKT